MEKPKRIIFYSWQSDLPGNTNRYFIEDALKKAVGAIAADDSTEVEPVIDRDTQGTPGAVDISKTIFEKIGRATVFVADVSIINQEKRPTPNPNVLIELGFALKSLETNGLILVMNKASGGPELLPFDLKMRKVIPYLAIEGIENSPSKKLLAGALEEQLRLILASHAMMEEEKTEGERLVEAIENETANRIPAARKYMKTLNATLEALQPGTAEGKKDYGEIVKDALRGTTNIVADFGNIIRAAAIADDDRVIKEIFIGFKPIVDHYYQPTARFTEWDFDFYKFIGDELFVTMIAVLIQEQKWPIIKTILGEHIVVDNLKAGMPGSVGFEYFGKFAIRSFGLVDRTTGRNPHADLLAERHSLPPIGDIVPLEDYIAADYFLLLRDKSTGSGEFDWMPWSTMYMKRPPIFIVQAEHKKNAEEVADALGGRSTHEFAHILKTSADILKRMWGALWDFPVDHRLIEKIDAFNRAQIIQ